MIRIALLFALAAALVQPQAPDPDVAAERYHAGAQAFVDGEIERARASVDAGLRAAPNDARLQALRDLIEQEQDEQDQREGGEQQEQNENPQDGSEGEEGQQSPGEGEQPPPPEDPEAEADQTRAEPQDPGEQESERQGQQPGQGGATSNGDAEAEMGQMSRAQAERILDAVGGEEQLLLRELQRRPTRGRRTDKDW